MERIIETSIEKKRIDPPRNSAGVFLKNVESLNLSDHFILSVINVRISVTIKAIRYIKMNFI